MKTMNNTIINSIMRNIVKYLCAVVLLIGTSTSAWGTTITLKVWNHDTGAYYDYGTFESGTQPGDEPMLYDGYYSYFSVVAWAPGEQVDFYHPSNNQSQFHGNYAWPNANYSGAATTLYAVYYSPTEDYDNDYFWTTKPAIPVILYR